MERRTLIAISLCFLIFIFWQKFYLDPRIPQPSSAPTTATAPATTSAPAQPQGTTAQLPQKRAQTVSPTKVRPAETRRLTSATGALVLSDSGPFFSAWNLRGYHQGIDSNTKAVDLATVTNEPSEVDFAFDDQNLAYLNAVQGSFQDIPNGAAWTYEDANVKLRREITTNPNMPYLDLKIEAEFKTKRPSYAFLSLASRGMEKDPEAQDRQLLYWTNQSIERVSVTESIDLKEIATTVKYIGAANRYFLLSLISQGPLEARGLIQQTNPYSGKASLVYPVTGNSISIPVRVYFGPKELILLRSVEPLLDHTVDFGWFTAFAYPLLKLLKWFYSFINNYGVAIILLTLLLKIVTYPLTYKSMKSMKEMAKIQPQIARIKEKHKDDREAMNREMLTLMKGHGYNPAAGCLPILVQMPVFFALYRVLYSSIELYHAPFALWIKDLSSADPYYVTPILLSITMYIQQKLTPTTATDPAQQKMMQLMPLIFGAFMLTLPSGLTLYMLVNALASIVQQLVLNKKLDTGHAPALAARTR